VEEPVLLQERLDALELLLRGADRGRGEHAGDDELKLALAAVDGWPPEDEDLGSVGRWFAGALRVQLPHAAPHLARGGAQDEVPVAAWVLLAAGHLAADPDIGEFGFDDPSRGSDHVADGPDVVSGGEHVELQR